jgi:transposase-like protein
MNQAHSSSEAAAERGRWSSRRKMEVVLRLLRGEALHALSRELGVTAATLAYWRDQFLAGGQSAVRSRPIREGLFGTISIRYRLFSPWLKTACRPG